jgi:ParB family chromosome partitioning protein
MAIIATLRTVENDLPGNLHSIASIPLSKLVPWQGNVRKTGPEDGLEELVASIAALGVLQSLVVRKANRGKYAILAGRRRYLALSRLAKNGTIAEDAPVPCRIVPGSADATEISLTENVVRAPMHPADQYDAFRELVDSGSTIAEIAARFGMSELAVKQRLKLSRVSPAVLAAYRAGDLSLEQVQAFAISDDQIAQEQLLDSLSNWNNDAKDIRSALTNEEIPATERRARFITLDAYEQAGGALRRDLFAEGDDGVFLVNPDILDRLVAAKLEVEAGKLRQEGWKWVEARPEFGYEARGELSTRRPEPIPVSEEARAEEKRLSEEYQELYEASDDHDEETLARLDAIEARIAELEETAYAFTSETLSVSGAVVTVGRDGNAEVIRGLVRGEDEASTSLPKERPAFSASLVERLTEHRSAAISAVLSSRPEIALASLAYSLSLPLIQASREETALQISTRHAYLRQDSKGRSEIEAQRARWTELLPRRPELLWVWCLSQTTDTLLSLLAFCAACSLDAVQRKGDRPDSARLQHAKDLEKALGLEMSAWFTPTADNYFLHVSRQEIGAALMQGKNLQPKRSWEKLRKSEFAAMAEREIAGAGWVPQPMR